jgi:di/tricarboxylate transporter
VDLIGHAGPWLDAGTLLEMDTLLIHQLLTSAVLVLVFVSFVREWFSPDLTAMGAFLFLVLCGVLDPPRALSVFASQAPITIAAMFIMSAVLERTGVIEALANRFEWLAGKQEVRVLIVLFLIVAFLSAFVNNTPVVVVFLPIVLRHCRKFDLKASRFLIPLSYAAIVGGTCTIIGTSTNLIASSIATDAGLKPFSMFEVSKLGILFVGITFLYLILGGRKLIPDRVTLAALFESESGREFLTQAYVRKLSPLVGKKFTETPLAKRREISVIEIVRERQPIQTQLTEVVFEAGDQILLKTRAGSIVELNESAGLELLRPEVEGEDGSENLGLANIRTESAVLMEGLIGTESRLVGHSLKDLNLRQRYGVLVLAVHRRGRNLKEAFQSVPLAFGDTLLIEGPVDRMNELFNRRDFINLSKPTDRPLRRRRAPIAISALVMFMIGGALMPGHIPIFALAAVLVTLLTRCIDSTEAYEAVEWRVIFMIFGMLGLGLCLQEVQIAQILAQGTVDLFGGASPYIVLSCIFLLSAILTEMISNNAVAALLTPIAIGVAQQLDVDPRPFVVAVMFASSASFVTPIGYQTNTYVYGAGGYKFSDFSRVGLPLAIMLWMVASFAIPWLWPF